MLDELAEKVVQGDRRALARLITRVESRDVKIAQVMAEIYEKKGNADIIGITGPPGAGKSTMTDRLTTIYRGRGRKVGIVAIDPSSPFSGGALLGDRIRMNRHATDPDVFIRSLGSRGSRGGLSRATREVTALMDVCGFDVIIVETVGVGQTELDIMDLAHSVVVVFVPESGDVVQTMKAGLTEIADLFVVNKSDRPGADLLERELQGMIEMSVRCDWAIPVVRTVAVKDEGMTTVVEHLDAHRKYLTTCKKDPDALGRMRLVQFGEVVSGLIQDLVEDSTGAEGLLGKLAGQVYNGTLNPYAAAQKMLTDPEMLRELFKGDGC
jgi:GTPase